MISKKYIISVGIIATLLVGASSLAFAENNGQNTESMKIKDGKDMALRAGTQMVLQIGGNGNVLMRGTISAVNTSSLTVKSWGGDWIVNIPSSTELLPQTTIAQFTVGDFVGVQGTVNETASWTIDARIVRDWTNKKAMQENRQVMKTERHNNEQEIKDVIKTENPKNWQGIASNINVDAKTFTLTAEGTAYTVNLVSDVKVVDRMFLGTSLVNVKEGDTVRVWGPVTGTTINAYVLRDITITPKTNTENR